MSVTSDAPLADADVTEAVVEAGYARDAAAVLAVTPERTVDLAIEGMTCASCVARVEKKLNRLPGVEATVNLPLESAHVRIDLSDEAGDDHRHRRARRRGPLRRLRRDGHPHVDARPVRTPAHHAPRSPATTSPTTGCPVTTCPGHGHQMDPYEHALSGHSMAPGHDMDPDEDTSAPTDARGADLRGACASPRSLTVPVAAALDDPRAAVHRLAVGRRGARPAGRHLGARGRSTGPPLGPPGTARRPWTPSSRSASSPRPAGRCGPCCFGGAGELGHDA